MQIWWDYTIFIWNLHGKYVDRRSGNDKWIIPSTAGFYHLHIGETWRCIKAEANYRNMQKEKKKNVWQFRKRTR